MITVYRLRDDAQYVKHVQEATLYTKDYGIRQTHGLFGSEEWWRNIASGKLPSQTLRGQITHVYMGSMGDWPEFKMRTDDGTEYAKTRQVNERSFDALYKVGSRIEIDYVTQYFKKSTPSGATENDCVIEVRIEPEA